MLLGFKCIDVDMFPRTDKRRKNVMISFRLRQNTKNAVDMFPVTSESLKPCGLTFIVFSQPMPRQSR